MLHRRAAHHQQPGPVLLRVDALEIMRVICHERAAGRQGGDEARGRLREKWGCDRGIGQQSVSQNDQIVFGPNQRR